jgi:hypothetical protein
VDDDFLISCRSDDFFSLVEFYVRVKSPCPYSIAEGFSSPKELDFVIPVPSDLTLFTSFLRISYLDKFLAEEVN